MPSPGGQFFSQADGDIEDYFVNDYELIDQYIGDQLWVWGSQNSGQLGTNDLINRSTPVTTFLGGTNWKFCSISPHLLAIKTDGTLWASGGNTSGQLGINNNTNRSTPVTTFAGGNNWKTCSGGNAHTLAIKTDGTLWTWGSNSHGQLGINNTVDRNTPVTTILGGTNWKSVIGVTNGSAAIKTDGTMWFWGQNSYGQLGVNDTNRRSTPVTTILGGTNWKSIHSGGYHTLAIKTDGTLWCFGRNNLAQLGINDTIARSTPVTTFAGGNNWKYVSAGSHTMSIKTDGSLWVWGFNGQGQLGINNTINRSTPVTTFAGGTNWKQVSGGLSSTAIKTNGTLWTWGNNTNGPLGVNDTINRSTPVTTILGGTNWKQVSAESESFISVAAITSGLNVDLS